MSLLGKKQKLETKPKEVAVSTRAIRGVGRRMVDTASEKLDKLITP